MKMNLEKNWTEGCTAFIIMMISAVGKSITAEIRKNGGARDA